ncbi:Cupin 2 barrel domain protein [Planoprotostelium fungivorum]|uniref:Cupin 2 barrel domain protein n=1 Tax=Planoprotostelium fungivorum TaxID=1890364 RepID=A0A2P6N4D5_9EUKA|nr:Cupin 2 barrel domain protein [Planoprotostelium fungivorum]
MSDTHTSIRVSSKDAPVGEMGQKYLAAGKLLSMRMWPAEKPTNEAKPASAREYETVGYVVSGRAQLIIEGETVDLGPGDSWVVPKGKEHTYRILEEFTAVEATTPPAESRQRDEPPTN